jgi:hypothetical protein
MTKILSIQQIKNQMIKDTNIQLKGKLASRVVTVINGYGKREGFFDNIGGIFYRIWNAVKAIFGQSDWQLAQKDVTKSWIEVAKAKDTSNNTENSSIPQKYRAKLHKFQKEYFLNLGNTFLSIAVDATSFQYPSTSELNKSMREKMGSAKKIFLTKINKKVAQTCPELSDRQSIVKALIG